VSKFITHLKDVGGYTLSTVFAVTTRYSVDCDTRLRHNFMDLDAKISEPTKSPEEEEDRKKYFARITNEIFVPGMTKEVTSNPRDATHLTTVLHLKAENTVVEFDIGLDHQLDCVEVDKILSKVHEVYKQFGKLDQFVQNYPTKINCAHPLETLVDKLEAINKRFEKKWKQLTLFDIMMMLLI